MFAGVFSAFFVANLIPDDAWEGLAGEAQAAIDMEVEEVVKVEVVEKGEFNDYE